MKKIFIIMQKEIVNTVGGTITIFIDYCNMLQENGYDVYGIFYSDITNRPSKLNKNVKFINLKNIKTQHQNFSEAINLLAKEEMPNLFIYFFPSLYVDSKLNNTFDKIPKIIMFHGRPDFYFATSKNLLKNFKPLCKNIIAQILLPSYINLLPKFIRNDKVYYIPNPATSTQEKINPSIEKKKIIFLSRIAPCKGIEFLIKSFKLVVKKHPDWILDIYGQSQPEQYENDLQLMINRLSLQNNIFIRGISENPIKTFLDYDFCVFPSVLEGFPMGLIEAQSTGLPAVGLEGCSGVNELIINGYNGYLSKRKYKNFADKINKLIESKDLRLEMSVNAKKEVEKYNRQDIYNTWLKLIDDVINNKFETNIDYNIKPKYKNFSIKKVVKWDKYDDSINDNFMKKLISFIFSIKSPQDKDYRVVKILGLKIKNKIRSDV